MEIMIILGNMLCFLAGAGVVLVAVRGGIHPAEAWQERQVKKQISRDNARLRMILQNVEAYDGTSQGQQELPTK